MREAASFVERRSIPSDTQKSAASSAHSWLTTRRPCTTWPLSSENHLTAVDFAQAADIIRGYEDVELRNVANYLAALKRLDIDGPTIDLK